MKDINVNLTATNSCQGIELVACERHSTLINNSEKKLRASYILCSLSRSNRRSILHFKCMNYFIHCVNNAAIYGAREGTSLEKNYLVRTRWFLVRTR